MLLGNTSLMSDNVPRKYVACKGLSDLGIGSNRNKPNVTIIGENSASYHHSALIDPVRP